jgi:mRNA-degrading endonuclease RelE of RelBE toxin-antitoxin system
MRLSVFKGLRDLVADPLSGKFLKGRLRRSWFFRVGDFRVIYEFSGDVVSVVSVEHRSVVYDE